MDAEGEQANDPEQIAEIAEEYEGLDPENLVENDQFEKGSKAAPSFFRTTPILDTDDLQEKTGILAWEQVCVLKQILEYLKDMTMSKRAQIPPSMGLYLLLFLVELDLAKVN